MKKIIYSFAAIVLCITICACTADYSNADNDSLSLQTTAKTSISLTSETVAETVPDNENTSTAFVSETLEVSEEDYIYLEENGFIEIASDYEIWRKFLACTYTNCIPESSKYGERRSFEGVPYEMIELIINVSDNRLISRIEKALNVTLVRNETNEYYLCPFKTFDEMRSAALKCFSEKRFDELYSDGFIKDYDGRLFVVDSVGGTPDGICVAAKINSISDESVEAVLAFDNEVFDDMYYITYVFIKQNGNWVIDSNR